MYKPTGHSIEDYLLRVPLEKLEQFLQVSGDKLPPKDYIRVTEILRLRKKALALREQYPRQLLEQWDVAQQRELLYTALAHKPLWVYEEIARDILDIWTLSMKASPVEMTPEERQYLYALWEKTRH